MPLLYPKKDIKWSAIFEIKVDAIGKCMVSVEGVVLNSVWDTVPFFLGGLSKSSEGSSEKSLVFFFSDSFTVKGGQQQGPTGVIGPVKVGPGTPQRNPFTGPFVRILTRFIQDRLETPIL